MSDQEAGRSPAADAEQTVATPIPQQAGDTAPAPTESNGDDLENDLFGDDDDDDDGEQIRLTQRNAFRQQEASTTQASAKDDVDDDDEDEGVRRKVRRPRQRVASNSASPAPTGSNGLAAPAPLDPSSPVRGQGDDRSDRSSRSGSPYDREGSQDLDEEARRQLEYKEDEEEDLPADDNIEVAHLALPQLPVRRTKEHWLARIPHFLRYVTTPFDPSTWDEDKEEQMLLNEGFNSQFGSDIGAASLLRTSNTIRWRYTDQVDEDGAKIPESNARIVRWSDGTMSLQVGSELFDITQQTEKGRVGTTDTGTNTPQMASSSQAAGPSSQLLSQATQTMPMGSSGSSNRPAQSLSYLVVPHEREEVMESQGPIAGTLAFTPADTQSETHRRIAKALRFQKTARVVATAAGAGALDPEVEKARIEKELKDAEKKRVRERQKADRKSGKFDDDMFDVDSRRRSRYVGGRKTGAGPRNADYYSDESDLGGAADQVAMGGSKRSAASAAQRYAEDDDDGFIVDDEGDDDEDEDGNGGRSGGGKRKKKRSSDDEDAMEVDDEPDEMELAEQKIEEAERARKKAAARESGAEKPRRPEPAFSSDEDEQDAETDKDAQAASQSIAKKKRIIESDDE
ncbi:related to LEO1 - component of the Paf1 complex [Melanopsichium pennsylvanicum]|uniref:Related to LEO1 - component of the Paf1 complex n=2 Tax=Melanopsichium pennsylvanicum TaxID=63383 RepID=A0AAJ4XTE0_9BASI|nr:conserved hypothetical protein [Melanopsichium pennsylvanicum 4]SNX87582.1 related to LEO1 - component of the Paf1 complex [Melanopsichium pennsylvanicum]